VARQAYFQRAALLDAVACVAQLSRRACESLDTRLRMSDANFSIAIAATLFVGASADGPRKHGTNSASPVASPLHSHPRRHEDALLLLLAWQLLMPFPAAAYSVMLRWDAPADPAVVGYRLYVREGDAEYGAPRDVLPEAGSDGRFATVLSDLAAERTYTFAVSAYTADGRESDRSNERSLGYADVAALVDSDGDGLADAAEDVNVNGTQDAAETDRLIPDSDGDLVADGIERARGTDPLDALSPACEPLRFAEFGYSSGGTAEIIHDVALNATVLRATETARKPLRFRASYPARGVVAVHDPIVVTELHSDRRFRVELTVRSTAGKRYTLRYDGNGGVDRRAGRTLTIALGTQFAASDVYAPFARDVAADLARLRPDAILDTITNVRIKGGYSMSELSTCG
jgi:hypothetical protein